MLQILPTVQPLVAAFVCSCRVSGQKRGCSAVRGRSRNRGHLGLRREILARVDEPVPLEPVLLVVQLAVPAFQLQQLFVGPPLDDLAVLEHENLIGALDGREPVRDHERRASAPERLQPVLDEPLAFAIEARGRLVEDQDLRIGEDGARDGDALALAARQPHPALADDRVVAPCRTPG